MLERLNAHREWANGILLDWIAAQPRPDDDCLRRLTHVLETEAVWLGRLRGGAPPKPSGEPRAAAELAALQRENRPQWEAVLAEPERLLRYANFAGTPCESTVAEIVTHACMHGMYHRGQVASQASRLGLQCPSTDFILFARWL